jgi:subtilisin family serine protease
MGVGAVSRIRRTRSFAIALVGSALVAGSLFQVSGAGAVADAEPSGSAEVGTEVMQTIARDGAADVFVMLDGARTGADVAALRQSTSATENRIVQALHPGIRVDRRLLTVPAFSAHLTSTDQLNDLAATPGVARIDVRDDEVRATIAHTTGIIGADVMHAVGYRGTGTTVAILDTGIDRNNSDLIGSVTHEACFGEDDNGGICPNGQTSQEGNGAAADDDGHGTHVAGILRPAGHEAAIGVAPAAGIVAIKVLDSEGTTNGFDGITAGLDYLVAHPEFGVDVVNMSLGNDGIYTGDCDTANAAYMAMAASVANLRAAGVVTVAASGNDSAAAMGAPGCLSGVLSVAASDTRDAMASFSNVSSSTDVVAPGVNVDSDAIGGGIITLSGTSMASPAVAGCVALLHQARPAATVASLESALKVTGTPIRRGSFVKPRINCSKALVMLAGAPLACPFRVITENLPFPTFYQPYSAQLHACGLPAVYKWKKLSKLPSGLKLNTKTGAITGTPKVVGQFPFRVQVMYKTKVKGMPAVKHIASRSLPILVYFT